MEEIQNNKNMTHIFSLKNAKLENFVIFNKLGSGGFGQVYNGYDQVG